MSAILPGCGSIMQTLSPSPPRSTSSHPCCGLRDTIKEVLTKGYFFRLQAQNSMGKWLLLQEYYFPSAASGNLQFTFSHGFVSHSGKCNKGNNRRKFSWYDGPEMEKNTFIEVSS